MRPTFVPTYHAVRLIVLAFFCTALVTACEQKQTDQIQWQMPLEAPDDLHSLQQYLDPVPTWATARQGEAEIVWLQKSTARTFTSKLALGGGTHIQGWDIQLLGLASGLRLKNSAFLNDKNVHNPAALVAIRHDGKLIYRGWLYKEFPELFGMDNPEWKVMLKNITLRAASQETSNTGSLSSAG